MYGSAEALSNLGSITGSTQLNPLHSSVVDSSRRKTAEEVNRYLTKPEIEKKIREVRKYMEKAAKSLEFIEAAKFRDEIKSLQKQLNVI